MLESKQIDPSVMVALRKESVDRNVNNAEINKHNKLSLSARRAWIEISGSTKPRARREVALRKESVDRNLYTLTRCASHGLSLSARRAWIEISA